MDCSNLFVFQFQNAFLAIVPPAEYVEDLLGLLLHNSPVRPDFLPNYMKITFERARRVLKMHPEFSSLSNSNQELLWSKNYLSAIAVHIAKVPMFYLYQ